MSKKRELHTGSQGDGHHHGHGHAHSHSHSHSHHHGHGHSHSHGRSGNKSGLLIALGITASIAILEWVGGWLTNSLALLSDAGHMLSDASSLVLSLLAIWFAARPATPTKSYGYYRVEILAALLNGVTLFIIAGLIIREAYERLLNPPVVSSGTMMVIASIGLLANLASAWALMKKGDVKGNINLRSAYLHVLGDALGSVGALLGGGLMMAFGWYIFDPIVSVLVSLLILKGAWGVITQSVHVLMEGVPSGIDLKRLSEDLKELPEVKDVHDVHVWSITSGVDAMSCHLVVSEPAHQNRVLQEALAMLEADYGITHATVQVESEQLKHPGCIVSIPG